MNQPARNPAPQPMEQRSSGNRSERMADLKKKHVKTGAVAAGGLLALVGLAAMLLGS
jgi:hypothetical protein